MIKKKILVLPGGKWQVPLIQKIKEMGHYVVCTNPNVDAIGFSFSDESYLANALDKEKNLEIAKKCNIDAVISDQSDISVPTVAYISEALGLPSIGTANAKLFTSKFQMCDFAKKNGFAAPSSALCTNVEEAISFLRKHPGEKKYVMKPDSSQSSRGVFFPTSKEEVEEHFQESQSFSSDKTSVIMQTYVPGTEFTIDGIFVDGKHYSLAISKKEHFSYNESIANCLLFGPNDDTFDYDLLRKEHNALMDKTKLPFSLTHTEYKFHDGKYYLIEMAARGGGTRIASDIVKAVSGIDNYAFYIQHVLGEKVDFPVKESYVSETPWAILKFYDDSIFRNDKGQRIHSIKGIDAIREMEGVIDSEVEVKPGDLVTQAKDDRSRVGYLVAKAATLEKLEDIVSRAEKTLEVELK